MSLATNTNQFIYLPTNQRVRLVCGLGATGARVIFEGSPWYAYADVPRRLLAQVSEVSR